MHNTMNKSQNLSMNNTVLSGLQEHGFSGKAGFDKSIFSVTRIDAIRFIIRTHLVTIKHISTSSSAYSYSLKHLIERYAYVTQEPILGNYVKNGECIYAMYLEGFMVKPEADGKNAYFNVSQKSVDVLRSVVSKLDH